MAKKMAIFWHQWSWALHLCGWVFFSGVAYANLSTHEGRIEKLERAKIRQEKMLTRMDYNIQIVAQKIGVAPLKADKDEEDSE